MINPLKKSRFCQLHWTFIPYDIFLKYLTKIQIKQIRIYIFCSVAFCWINGKNRTERKKREYLSRIFVPMGKVINFRREKSVKSDLHTRSTMLSDGPISARLMSVKISWFTCQNGDKKSHILTYFWIYFEDQMTICTFLMILACIWTIFGECINDNHRENQC